MPLESGEFAFTRPWGKAEPAYVPVTLNLSGARFGSTTEGEDRSNV
jgi:hypothetical protein